MKVPCVLFTVVIGVGSPTLLQLILKLTFVGVPILVFDVPLPAGQLRLFRGILLMNQLQLRFQSLLVYFHFGNQFLFLLRHLHETRLLVCSKRREYFSFSLVVGKFARLKPLFYASLVHFGFMSLATKKVASKLVKLFLTELLPLLADFLIEHLLAGALQQLV